MHRIVVISGKQGSGKTTLQNNLARCWQVQPRSRAFTVNFADAIYEMHDHIRNIGKKYGIEPIMPKDGKLLQLLGTEWGREQFGSDVWVKCLRERIIQIDKMNLHYENVLFIIGDCRFENEFDAFPTALRVRLECPEHIRKERCSNWRPNVDHTSEIGLDLYTLQERFDLIGYSKETNESGLTDIVMAQLLKNTWIEKRKLA